MRLVSRSVTVCATFLFATVLSACAPYARITPPDAIYVEKAGRDAAGNPRNLVDQGFKRALDQYWTATASKEASTVAAALPSLFAESIGLADYQCLDYFNRLGRASRDLAWTRYETSLTGGVVSSMLGLAGQSAKTIANTGAAFGFTTASMDNYENNYLFSPDVGAVQILVRDAQLKLKSSWGNTSTIDSWGQMISLVKEYEDICQPHSIRHLINASLVKGAAKKSAASSEEATSAGLLSETKLDFGTSLPSDKPIKRQAFYTQQADNPATLLTLVSSSDLLRLSDESTCKLRAVLKKGEICSVVLEFGGAKAGHYNASFYLVNDRDGIVRALKLIAVVQDK